MSHTEQLNVILRLVLINEFTKKIKICEHFIKFCPITDSIGAGLYDRFVSKIKFKYNDWKGGGWD